MAGIFSPQMSGGNAIFSTQEALVASAPLVSTNPVNQAVEAGQSATFYASSSGYPEPTVQWQRNGSNIGGATSPTYTTPATAVSGGSASNGDTYRAVFTNASGTATSAAATLTVVATGNAADFERWLPFVLPDAPGCPRDTAIHHIRQAAMEFLELTHAWQVDLPAVLSVAGEPDYAMTLPAESSAVKLFAFAWGENEGHVLDVAAGRSKRPSSQDDLAAWIVNRKTVGINPAPSASGVALVFRVSLKPTQAALTVPDEVFEQYADAIAAGALSRILRVGGQAWTDLPQSDRQRGSFMAAVDKVQWQVQKNFGRTKQRSRSSWF